MSLPLPVIVTLRKTVDLGLQRGLFRIGDVPELARALGALEAEENAQKLPPGDSPKE